MTSQDAVLRVRTEDLARALEVSGSRLDDNVFGRIATAVASVRERLALGVDHTVVALAGGTGSGKSSMFNKISRLTFADVGVKRPTTAKVTACAWSDDAAALLDWLGVERERRITRAGELDAADEDGLAGLVLLDLPDHDSVEPGHRDIVNKVLPLVDLLVWVVDPQKYADDALHSGYLRESVGLEASMVVALNQMDTVPVGQRETLVNDVKRLLREDGLDGVPVAPVSARTGAGLDELRGLLEKVVARRSVAAGRAAGEIESAALLLLDETPAEVPWHTDAVLDREIDALAQAAGLEAVARQVAAAVRNGYGRPEFPAPDPDAIALSRARWLTGAGDALRPGWQRSLAESVASAETIGASVVAALRGITLDTSGPSSAKAMRRTAFAAAGVAVVMGVATVLAATGLLAVDQVWTTVLGVVALLAALVGIILLLALVQVRRTLARRREQAVVASGRGALERVLVRTLGEPTQRLLDEHREVRELAQAARDDSPAVRLELAPSPTTGSQIGAPSPGMIRLPDARAVRA
ncbi:50S ribosome-binding GTPase [Antribacter sp. KLBMP9083]|uniref:50S ribosome-binding GTPase n=1 Tax=Antribacter soli TaxID=2910976 RepID=A0AA41UA30_9MICO|nr:GTP-binding protein [Antribacter soli]MCF4119729.1 50S ribosome-binding GTPase [Antribacter soli]